MKPKHERGPPMDLANSAASANFLAAYEAGDEQVLWQAIVYCAGHLIPIWEWLANELVMPCSGGTLRLEMAKRTFEAGPPMDLANMRRQGVLRREASGREAKLRSRNHERKDAT
jgi:hypothetical protein